jgi:hypothetical protein
MRIAQNAQGEMVQQSWNGVGVLPELGYESTTELGKVSNRVKRSNAIVNARDKLRKKRKQLARIKKLQSDAEHLRVRDNYETNKADREKFREERKRNALARAILRATRKRSAVANTTKKSEFSTTTTPQVFSGSDFGGQTKANPKMMVRKALPHRQGVTVQQIAQTPIVDDFNPRAPFTNQKARLVFGGDQMTRSFRRGMA